VNKKQPLETNITPKLHQTYTATRQVAVMFRCEKIGAVNGVSVRRTKPVPSRLEM
jgi:hypothetical protein